MTAVILGIDPGVNGAIAVLSDDGSLIDVHDMPALADADEQEFDLYLSAYKSAGG